jgi:UrcA family protein
MKYLAIVSVLALTSWVPANRSLADTLADDVPTRLVDYSDLDLSRPAGVGALFDRIESAARVVCNADDSRDLEHLARARRCIKGSISRAVAEVNSRQLTDHLAKVHPEILAATDARLNR